MKRPAPATIPLALVLLLCATFCLTQLAEVDLHWHLLAGQRILEEQRVPRVDSFSYTSEGRPWVDLQWLFQLIVAAIHRWGGWVGLDLLKCLLITGGFAGAIGAARGRGASRAVIGALALGGVVASQERFTLRPEAASFLLLGALMMICERRRERPRTLWLAPPLLVLWANLHALYAVGLALLALLALGDGLDLIRSRQVDSPAEGPDAAGVRRGARAVLAALGVAAPATLLTPYGLAGWVLPLRLLFERVAADNLYGRNIAEFQATFGGYGPTASIRAFGLLALVVVAGALLAWRGARSSDLLVIAAFLGLALLARRNIPLFVLAALPPGSCVVGAALDRLSGVGSRSGRIRTSLARAGPRVGLALVALVALVLVVDVVTNRFYARDGTQRFFGRGEAPGFYPRGAADFVLEKRLGGEAINDLTMGGFLAWRWSPRRRVFIDGRLELYGEDLFATYLRLQGDPRLFEEAARRYGADVVVWSHRHSPEAAPLLRFLAGGHGWRLVYVDLAAAVFVREAGGASTQDLPAIDPADPELTARILAQIAAAERDAASSDPLPTALRRLLPRRAVPVAQVNTALFFAVLGSARPAEVLFRQALQIDPDNPLLHYDLGLVLDQARRSREARAQYEEALRLNPAFATARSALALVLLHGGDPDAALAQWRLAERDGVLGP
ncbi:MAG TPA: tetratricopeptide repeat protein, partial [Candidatus Polarisedimenticolia bacterium]|nr:tetratricopeptide repeat protein [Candidatus Polarisedimenticolia bacterium]